jgi:hypothetical protein
MYYDDEGRRLNLATGFLLGLTLGCGLVALVNPARLGDSFPALKNTSSRLRRRYQPRLTTFTRDLATRSRSHTPSVNAPSRRHAR